MLSHHDAGHSGKHLPDDKPKDDDYVEGDDYNEEDDEDDGNEGDEGGESDGEDDEDNTETPVCRLQMYHSSKHVKRCATKMCSCIQTYCL